MEEDTGVVLAVGVRKNHAIGGVYHLDREEVLSTVAGSLHGHGATGCSVLFQSHVFRGVREHFSTEVAKTEVEILALLLIKLCIVQSGHLLTRRRTLLLSRMTK